jgi:hypothetical protein
MHAVRYQETFASSGYKSQRRNRTDEKGDCTEEEKKKTAEKERQRKEKKKRQRERGM